MELDFHWMMPGFTRPTPRNLSHGEWAYIPGHPSAGSTAPLWTLLLVGGYILNINPTVWSYFLGLVSLSLLVVVAIFEALKLPQHKRPVLLLFVLIVIFEYHLVWAALSGMETILFSLAIFLVLFNLPWFKLRPFIAGAYLGLLLWIRPDGITLLGPLLLYIFFQRNSWHGFVRQTFYLLLGMSLFIFPYLMFNWNTAGSFWPSTFYAKQAEYASLSQLPFINRFISLLSLPLIGVGTLLVPGAIFYVYNAVRQRKLDVIAGYLWWIGYVLIYAFRLPVTYQHGRYLIPLMPIFFIWGISGTVELLDKMSDLKFGWIINRAWVASILIILFSFWILGAQAYANDVSIIESEMVVTSKWISNNTPRNALIAAHDIGALGYYGNREIFDLAGLITPDVVPYFSDETSLSRLMRDAGSNYLMTFPDWYDRLTECGEIIFTTDSPFSTEAGGSNMIVYKLISGCNLQ